MPRDIDPAFVAFAVGMILIGVFLLGFYTVRFIRIIQRPAEGQENRLSMFGGWAGGCLFVAGGSVFFLPGRIVWTCIPAAIVLLLFWFPLTAWVRRLLARAVRQHNQ
jgi:hypothetical protein